MTRFVYHSTDRYLGSEEINKDRFEAVLDKLLELYRTIFESGETVWKEESLYEVEIFPGIALCDLIYGAVDLGISQDYLAAFRDMVNQSPIIIRQDLTDASVVGTIGLASGSADLDLSNIQNWVSLVRLDLTLSDNSVERFFSDFLIAFPRLKFSKEFPDCLNTFSGGYRAYRGVITRCLTSLNDHWIDVSDGDLSTMLRAFSTQSKCPTTMEGNGKRKQAFTFAFSSGPEHSELAICEPHMKLESSDTVGDTEYYYHRIYFYPRNHNSFADKILVGHAGKHL